MRTLLHTAILVTIPLLVLAPTTFGSNESSYLYGKTQGKLDWKSCTTYADKNGDAPDCVGVDDSCHSPLQVFVRNQTTGLLDGLHPHLDYNTISNQTACHDGYEKAWSNVCDYKKAMEFSLDCP